MNFTKEKSRQRSKVMNDGDLVIVYERHDSLNHFYLKAGTVFNNKFGSFWHDDMIGKHYGSKIKSFCTEGYVYLLEPTPELWSIAVHTRTQIVDEVDSSYITLQLNLFPGCTVVESGTGSGCMTLSIARAISPSGRVHTFEYNSNRAVTAQEEFNKLGVGNVITVQCSDVCGKYAPHTGAKAGFYTVANQVADAVFLDLPEPWLALDEANRVMKRGSNICCYSPCLEQVMKTCDKLRELKFQSIRMVEVRQRPVDGRVIEMETIDLGLKGEEERINNNSVRDEVLKLQINGKIQAKMRNYKDTRRQKRIEEIETSIGETVVKSDNGEDDHDDEDDNNLLVDSSEYLSDKQSDDPVVGEKRSRELLVDTELDEKKTEVHNGNGEGDDGQVEVMSKYARRIMNRPVSAVNGIYTMALARPNTTMKGHTAFLTFATAPLY